MYGPKKQLLPRLAAPSLASGRGADGAVNGTGGEGWGASDPPGT